MRINLTTLRKSVRVGRDARRKRSKTAPRERDADRDAAVGRRELHAADGHEHVARLELSGRAGTSPRLSGTAQAVRYCKPVGLRPSATRKTATLFARGRLPSAGLPGSTELTVTLV